MDDNKSLAMGRRSFLRTAAVFSILPAAAITGYAANSKITLGIIGCGGRGRWIARLFEEFADFKVYALHDYFRDRVNQTASQVDVPTDRHFVGLDGYLGLLDEPVDAVAVESPPYFHPEQTIAALERGKHVFLAKPAAVDVPGCMAILDASRRHRDTLSLLVDFQTRNNELYREAADKVHAGAIGAPVFGHCYYHCGRLGIKAHPGTETARLRNWVFDQALSGDIIVEQNIHVIDVANWLLNGRPLTAWGTGGRKARVDVGDAWDHFSVIFKYPGDVTVNFSSVQFAKGSTDALCMRLYGDQGTADTNYGGPVSIGGAKVNWPGGHTGNIFQDGAVNNIRDFHAAIAQGKPINTAEAGMESTLAGILGRTAAYEGRLVTWEEMLARNERLDARLDLPADGPDTDDLIMG